MSPRALQYTARAVCAFMLTFTMSTSFVRAAAADDTKQPEQPETAQAKTEQAETVQSESLRTVSERGPVRAVVSLEPAAPRIGDTLVVTLEVTADKDVELLMPEFGQALERFPIVDFFPEQRLDDQGRTVSSQRYTLELTASGKASIPPLIVEFVDHREDGKPAPDGEDAYELLTERMPFEVESVVPSQAAAELRPPLGDLESLRSARSYWIAAVVGVLLLAGALLLRRVLAAWNPQALRESAYEAAIARLSSLVARPLPGADEVGAFFVELSDLIRRYLEDRFELRAPELTTEEFLTVAAASPDLSAEHKGFLREFLQSADMVKFARFVPGEQEIGDALDHARHFLEQTRDDASSGTASNSTARNRDGSSHA